MQIETALEHLLFVYGTLMRGDTNAHIMAGAHYVGAACTAAHFTLYDLGDYPAAVAGGHTAIKGELFTVDAAQLRRIDVFEDHPTLYRRETIRLMDGSHASIYLLPPTMITDASVI